MIKTPVCVLTADNKPLNEVITARIMSVTVTDNRANEADELEIELDDSDGKLELPRRGVKINCKLGFLGEELIDKGNFIVDETEWSGTPDKITVRASSANFKGNITEGKSKSHHRKTFGQISNEIAKNHKLKLVMTAELQSINLHHIDQTNESDLNLLHRLAKQNGAELAVKKDRLLIFKAGSARTASGKKLPKITLTRRDGDQFKYSEQDRDSNYTGVTAGYQNMGKATRKHARVGEKGKVKRLKGTYANEAEANRAAKAKMAEMKRQKFNFSINMALGEPKLSTETPVKLTGFKKEIDALNWIVSKATHHYSTSGLTTQIDLESS